MKCFSVIIIMAVMCCDGQREAKLPLSTMSLRLILRGLSPAVPGASIEDVVIRHYGPSLSSKSYKIRNLDALLNDTYYDVRKPTVIYAHGYVELLTDETVSSVIEAYLRRGDHNLLVLDWTKISFGNFVKVVHDMAKAGTRVGQALRKLIKRGFPLSTLHLVGNSMGSHLVGEIARYLASRGLMVPRLTGLDPAYFGFYPPFIIAPAMSRADASFVDVIHTDAGGFGTPTELGHVDFWPNEGQAKQPGCVSASIPLTVEDFCSHYRTRQYWVESLASNQFLARRCKDYDTFLRGGCSEEPMAYMGLGATPDLRGNYYLRTAATPPYALGERGAS